MQTYTSKQRPSSAFVRRTDEPESLSRRRQLPREKSDYSRRTPDSHGLWSRSFQTTTGDSNAKSRQSPLLVAPETVKKRPSSARVDSLVSQNNSVVIDLRTEEIQTHISDGKKNKKWDRRKTLAHPPGPGATAGQRGSNNAGAPFRALAHDHTKLQAWITEQLDESYSTIKQTQHKESNKKFTLNDSQLHKSKECFQKLQQYLNTLSPNLATLYTRVWTVINSQLEQSEILRKRGQNRCEMLSDELERVVEFSDRRLFQFSRLQAQANRNAVRSQEEANAMGFRLKLLEKELEVERARALDAEDMCRRLQQVDLSGVAGPIGGDGNDISESPSNTMPAVGGMHERNVPGGLSVHELNRTLHQLERENVNMSTLLRDFHETYQTDLDWTEVLNGTQVFAKNSSRKFSAVSSQTDEIRGLVSRNLSIRQYGGALAPDVSDRFRRMESLRETTGTESETNANGTKEHGTVSIHVSKPPIPAIVHMDFHIMPQPLRRRMTSIRSHDRIARPAMLYEVVYRVLLNVVNHSKSLSSVYHVQHSKKAGSVCLNNSSNLSNNNLTLGTHQSTKPRRVTTSNASRRSTSTKSNSADMLAFDFENDTICKALYEYYLNRYGYDSAMADWYIREFVQSVVHCFKEHPRLLLFAKLLGGYTEKNEWYEEGVPACALPPDAWKVVVYALRLLSVNENKRRRSTTSRRNSLKNEKIDINVNVASNSNNTMLFGDSSIAEEANNMRKCASMDTLSGHGSCCLMRVSVSRATQIWAATANMYGLPSSLPDELLSSSDSDNGDSNASIDESQTGSFDGSIQSTDESQNGENVNGDDGKFQSGGNDGSIDSTITIESKISENVNSNINSQSGWDYISMESNKESKINENGGSNLHLQSSMRHGSKDIGESSGHTNEVKPQSRLVSDEQISMKGDWFQNQLLVSNHDAIAEQEEEEKQEKEKEKKKKMQEEEEKQQQQQQQQQQVEQPDRGVLLDSLLIALVDSCVSKTARIKNELRHALLPCSRSFVHENGMIVEVYESVSNELVSKHDSISPGTSKEGKTNIFRRLGQVDFIELISARPEVELANTSPTLSNSNAPFTYAKRDSKLLKSVDGGEGLKKQVRKMYGKMKKWANLRAVYMHEHRWRKFVDKRDGGRDFYVNELTKEAVWDERPPVIYNHGNDNTCLGSEYGTLNSNSKTELTEHEGPLDIALDDAIEYCSIHVDALDLLRISVVEQ